MIVAEGLGYRFTSGEVVGPVDLHVRAGELVVLTGPTGAGKSVLLRALVGLASRHGQGDVLGKVRIDGVDPADVAPAARVALVGFAGQDARDQLVAGTVGDEIAFGLESAGASRAVIDHAVATWADRAGVPPPTHRPTMALSGGERHRLLVAAVLAGGARALVLDEPLAHLDAAGTRDLVALLRALASEGCAVVVAEHRLAAVWGIADRIVAIDRGLLVADAAPAAFPYASLRALGLWSPDAPPATPLAASPPGPVVARVSDLVVRYGNATVLDRVTLDVRAGERIALLGNNGAGKSTLLGALAALPGALLVPQDPDLALFRPTVREEITYGPQEHGSRDVEGKMSRVAVALSVADLLDRPPQALSRGQRLRVAVAGMLACEPRVLLLDEPTSGQDPEPVARLFDALVSLGVTVVFATHDRDVARRFATRAVVLDAGRVTYDGPVEGVQERLSAPIERGVPVAFPTAAGLDPRLRVLLVFGVATVAAVVDRPVAVGVLLAVTGLAIAATRPDPRDVLRGFVLWAAIAWATVVSQGLFYSMAPRTPWFALGPLVVWTEGVRYGLVQSLRYAVLLSAGLALVTSTSVDRLLAALVRLGLPFGGAFLAASALRFVPVVAGEALTVRAARAARGRPVWRRSPFAWLALEVALVLPVAARALRRAQVLAEALDARGFDPVAPRTERDPLRFRGLDLAVGGVAFAAVVAVVGLRFAFVLYTTDTAWSPVLLPLYSFTRRWL